MTRDWAPRGQAVMPCCPAGEQELPTRRIHRSVSVVRADRIGGLVTGEWSESKDKRFTHAVLPTRAAELPPAGFSEVLVAG